MSTKAQLESKVASLEALLAAEERAHAATREAYEMSKIDAVEAVQKLDNEWKATMAGVRARHALEYRKLTNTSGVSVADRASVSAGSQRPAEGESNAQFIARMRKEAQSQTATH